MQTEVLHPERQQQWLPTPPVHVVYVLCENPALCGNHQIWYPRVTATVTSPS